MEEKIAKGVKYIVRLKEKVLNEYRPEWKYFEDFAKFRASDSYKASSQKEEAKLMDLNGAKRAVDYVKSIYDMPRFKGHYEITTIQIYDVKKKESLTTESIEDMMEKEKFNRFQIMDI